MPAARDPQGGFQIPLARDRFKDVRKRRAVLTADGSSVVAARVPNELLRAIEKRASIELLSTADFLRRALLREIRKDKR